MSGKDVGPGLQGGGRAVALRRAPGKPKGRQPEAVRRARVRELIAGLPRRRDLLLEYLHRIQDSEGCLPVAMLAALAEELRLAQTEVFEVASFHHHFDVVREAEPNPPALTVRVCESLSCELAGGADLLARLPALLGEGVRVQAVPCIGRCDEAPVAVVGRCPVGARGAVAAHDCQHPGAGPARADEGDAGSRDDSAGPPAGGGDPAALVARRVQAAVAAGLRECPLPQAQDLAAYRSAGGYRVLAAVHAARLAADPGAARACGAAHESARVPSDGWAALREAIIGRLDAAGLRGLGGAGFPAARKWRAVAAEPGPRLLVVNADEGEPGTFKDRWCLENAPHRVLEAMLVAAAVVDCEACYLYLRDEYAGVRALLERELAALAAQPPLSPGCLPGIHLRRGAGAYICGEESALIESIEGRRGMPRLRPPYVAQAGLFGRPTLVHNVETLERVAAILYEPAADEGVGSGREAVAASGGGDRLAVDRGGECADQAAAARLLRPGDGSAWAAHGRRGRRGLRLFSVSGRVREPGVKCAPAGISLRELVEEHCGGMAEGHELYAYLPGGASGGILPAALADLPLDFDTLQAHGSFIGSAAVIVLSRQDRARDAAVNLMAFFRHESCGKCTPCRVGTAKAEALMRASDWNAALLGELSGAMADASICGLGQAAPNPPMSVIRWFGHELAPRHPERAQGR